MNQLTEEQFSKIFDDLQKEAVVRGCLGLDGWTQMCSAMESFAKKEGFKSTPDDGEDHVVSKEEYPECFSFMAGAQWGARWMRERHKFLFSQEGSEQAELVKRVKSLEDKLAESEDKIKGAARILKSI